MAPRVRKESPKSENAATIIKEAGSDATKEDIQQLQDMIFANENRADGISQSVSEMSTHNEDIKEAISQLTSQVVALQAKVSALLPEDADRIMPAALSNGLKPADVYMSALSGAVMAICNKSPSSVFKSASNREALANEALDFATDTARMAGNRIGNTPDTE